MIPDSLRDRLVTLLGFFLPDSPLKKALLRRLGGWIVDDTAYVGHSLFVGVKGVELGARSRIGHGSMFRGLSGLVLGEGTRISQWNWITASPAYKGLTPLCGKLIVGRETSITLNHSLDCSGGITIGDFSLLAGRRSTLLTHQIDVTTNSQTVVPITIGSWTLVSSNVSMTPGSEVADKCLVAMASVVTGKLGTPGRLYAGVPAKDKKEISGAFFERTSGPVLPEHLKPLET